MFSGISAIKSRRSSSEVLRDMLYAAHGGAKKTHIMFRSNVNPVVLEKYLKFCLDNGLIVKDQYGYSTTPKGIKLLRCLDQIRDLKRTISEAESEAKGIIE
jgi:predicted transcriptional regulator